MSLAARRRLRLACQCVYQSSSGTRRAFAKGAASARNVGTMCTSTASAPPSDRPSARSKASPRPSLPLASNGWLIDAELLYWMQRSGARWTEIPVRVIERTAGRSTVGVGTPVAVLRELIHFLRTKDRARDVPGRAPVRTR